MGNKEPGSAWVCVVLGGGLFVDILLPLSLWSPEVLIHCLFGEDCGTSLDQGCAGERRIPSSVTLLLHYWRGEISGYVAAGGDTHAQKVKEKNNSWGAWILPLCPINPDRPPQLQVHRVSTVTTSVRLCVCVSRIGLSETPAIDQGSRQESRESSSEGEVHLLN